MTRAKNGLRRRAGHGFMGAWLAMAACYNGGPDGDDDAASDDGSSTDLPEPGPTTGESTDPTDEPLPEALCWEFGAVCLGPAPAGWSGPFVLFDGLADGAPGCPDAQKQVFEAHDELLPVSPAVCGTCSCGSATGGACGAVPVTAYQMPEPAACGGCVSEYQVQAGVCTTILACGDPVGSIVMQSAPASGGACTPAGPGVDLPPIAWGRTAVGCAGNLDAPGCGAGEACIPVGEAPFEPGVCIAHPGDVECPGAPYDELRRFYQGVDDARGCAPCTCGPSHDARCDGKLTLFHYTSNGCNVPDVDAYGIPANCTWKSGDTEVIVTLDPPYGGACDPAGGAPSGAAAPNDPVTVCCAAAIEPGPVG